MATLMLALAVVLAVPPWDRDEAPGPGPGIADQQPGLRATPSAPATGRRADPAPPAAARGDATQTRSDEPIVRRVDGSEQATTDRVTPSVPGPLAPDVVVARDAGAESWWSHIRAAHDHVPDSAEDHVSGALSAGHAASMPSSDAPAAEGPEPGARYWFGPRGLMRLDVSTETQP